MIQFYNDDHKARYEDLMQRMADRNEHEDDTSGI